MCFTTDLSIQQKYFSDIALKIVKLQQLKVQKTRQILCADAYALLLYPYCYLVIVKQSMKMHMRDVPTVIGSDRC